ncbi:MAG: hypothetical protein QMD11_04745 [Smithella sp.]|nr:hypothetical protein [Smithella sp.]
MIKNNSILTFFICLIVLTVSCATEFGRTVIHQPDEYRHVYEAKEKAILNAIARVIKEKDIGVNARVDYENSFVDSDYKVTGDWRTKAQARVQRLNWKENEVALSVITERQTKTGWEMRRLLQKEQYDNLFSEIDLRIYEEMSKIE